MFANLFNWRTSVSDNEATHEIIDDKQDLERACNYAENAFAAVEAGAVFHKKNQKFKYDFFLKKFRKYR